jgi:lipopolysaccharide heptosyltransferase I
MNRLLILRLSALGDVLHTMPAVLALRASLPDARLAWVVEEAYRDLVETVAGVDAIPVTMKRWRRAPLSGQRAMRFARSRLRQFARGETSIDFQGLVKSAMIGWLGGARERWGFDGDAVRERPSMLFTNRRAAVDRSAHVVEWNLDLARAVVPHLKAPPDLDFSRFAVAPASDLRDAIVLLPGAGKPEKQWPVDRFQELARRIGPRALTVWGPGERTLADAIGARVAPPTNLRELTGILQRARVVIGGDTGPLHLAAALGTTVVGLYATMSPARNGPWGQIERCVDVSGGPAGMEAISVEMVWRRFEQLPA